ncbi:GntR family transcriptional regulator [Pseudorhodoferax sp. Leaf267]|uniref:GntR family transcriptional regulator n=1 Tax=Pseudorhodoferax sp. Leaf267 TaxID=1736316 RepID=UPI0006F746BB|nr:GntR family transcriptional regulator [Pseudorhodoferax sp. Leaf267]KQP18411.1 GntR family transcriptional regulator [Pseudorhodoferax sp. Leaf267]
MASASEISERIVEAVMAQKLAPGARLGEQPLAMLFDCSRTVVREALTRLAARGIVTVSARRGWYVIEPSEDDAREAFEARRVIETGLIRSLKTVHKPALKRLKAHLAREKAALTGSDVGMRSFLLGDFHVCLAECLGNTLLADTLRDFTARTTLIAMLYQSPHNAVASCEDHVQIVAALERGDFAQAEQLMAAHIGTVQDALRLPIAYDPLAQLRQALAPVAGPVDASEAQVLRTRRARAARPAGAPASGTAPDEPSTYLGALL